MVLQGDIWAESTMLGLRWRYFACMEGAVYDISEWAACQSENLKHLQANTHSVQYRIVSGKKNPPSKRNTPEFPRFVVIFLFWAHFQIVAKKAKYAYAEKEKITLQRGSLGVSSPLASAHVQPAYFCTPVRVGHIMAVNQVIILFVDYFSEGISQA